MGESQSRYSIVERLTDRKLSLMSKMDSLDATAKRAEQKAANLKKNAEADKEAIRASRESDIADLNRQIESHKKEIGAWQGKVDRDVVAAEQDARNAVNNVKSEKESLEKQIVAIDDALKKLEEISKTAIG